MNTNTPSSILRKVSCINCQNVVCPPAVQCKNWHLVCNNCRETLTNCPGEDCNEDISSAIRSSMAEKLLEKYIIRCKYFSDGKGCLQAFCVGEAGETDPSIGDHENNCPLRETKCYFPGCFKLVKLVNIVSQHFGAEHFLTPCKATEFNVSELVIRKNAMVNEVVGERTFKAISSVIEIDDVGAFLAVFRMSSLIQTIFEISVTFHPYFISSQLNTDNFRCKVFIENEDWLHARYYWEGPILQKFLVTPNISFPDEKTKFKWKVRLEVFEEKSSKL